MNSRVLRILLVILIIFICQIISIRNSCTNEDSTYADIIAMFEKKWYYSFNVVEATACLKIHTVNECFPEDNKLSLKTSQSSSSLPVKETTATAIFHTEVIPSGITDVSFGRITIRNSIPNKITVKRYLSPLLKRIQKNTRVRGYIVVLNNNAGGFVSGAVEILRYFSQFHSDAKNMILEIRRSPNNTDGNSFYYTDKPGIVSSPCITVLVNKRTASSAEAIAHVLQQWKAYVVGEVTFKKGSVQIEQQLDSGLFLRFTTGILFFSSNQTIHNRGVIPNFITNDTHTQWEEARKYLRTCYTLHKDQSTSHVNITLPTHN
jgi:hypothetical protein